jgi:WD40 repeat protein
MTLDVTTGRTHQISGVGPVVWSPADGYEATPVTSVSADCRTIQLSRADGRDIHTLAGIPELQTTERPPRGSCPVTILSWSPDGRWLAIGLGPSLGATGWMILLDPLTQDILELPQLRESGLTPVAVTWSPDGRVLLAECRMQNGEPFTIEVSPDGDAVAHDIVAGQVSWSPDGRWILGQALNGWVAFDARDPLTWALLAGYRAHWIHAAWCCPPSTRTEAAERTEGPPALLRPTR